MNVVCNRKESFLLICILIVVSAVFSYLVWPENEKEDPLVPLKNLLGKMMENQNRHAVKIDKTLLEISNTQKEGTKKVETIMRMARELKEISPDIQEALVDMLDTSTLYKNHYRYEAHRKVMEGQLQNAKKREGFFKEKNKNIVLDNVDVDTKVQYKMIVMVFSHSINFERRALIRQFWGNASMWNTKDKFKLIFLLGGIFDEAMVRRIYNESKLYRDIILESIPEGYFTTSSKLALGLHWLSLQGLIYEFALKADDDVFVHIDNAMATINSAKYRTEHFFGNMEEHPLPQRAGRYKINKIEYPHNRYPAFHSGAGVFMSKVLVKRIAPYFEFVNPLKLEDVYLAFVVQKYGGGVKPIRCQGYDLYNENCDYRKGSKYMFVHPVKKHGCMKNISRGALDEKH